MLADVALAARYVRFAVSMDRERPASAPAGILSQARETMRRAILSARNGYRFAKYEGESIVTTTKKRLKTAGFCDSARCVRSLRSRSIHRDA